MATGVGAAASTTGAAVSAAGVAAGALRLPAPRLPPRRRSAHKGDAGHVLVIGGAAGYAKRLRHGESGKGLNDYDAIFTELKRVGFDGWISIEDGVDGIDQLRRSADFLKRKTAQYWG